MIDFGAFIPPVQFELIPIKDLVSNQDYQRHLSIRHIERMAANFDVNQINPVKVSHRDGLNYVMNGQHTIETVTKVSGSRETPVWSMVYNNLDYETEARIFANQQKYVNPLSAYDIFAADIEAGEDKPIIIQDLVESYGLRIAPKRAVCSICAVYCLVQLYEKYGYHVLDRTLRLAVAAWEGESQSLSASMLRGIAHLVITFGEQLRDDGFAERLGQSSSREIVRDAKMRSPGAIGYSEIMLIAYNKNRKGCLSMSRLRDSKPYVYQNTEELSEEQAVSAPES
jgi:hypothetical protein